MRAPIAVSLLALAAFASAQQEAPPELEPVHVAGKVWVLDGAEGKVGVSVGADGVLMVDDLFAPMAENVRAAIAKIGGETRLRYVLNTHWHGDHTGGNVVFGPEAPIIAHHNVRRRLAEGQDRKFMPREVEPAPAEALPVITYEQGLSLHFNGEEIRVLHLPHGHTDGDSVVWFSESRVVHLGDLMFNGVFPFVDLESGGSVQGVLRNVERVLEWTADAGPGLRFIPGHGELASRADLEVYRELLEESLALVRQRLADGMGLEQIKQAGVPERWAGWSWRFIDADTWLEIVTRSVVAGPR